MRLVAARFQGFFFKRLISRRVYRFIFAKFYLEILVSVFFAAIALLNGIGAWILYLLVGAIAGEFLYRMSRKVGFLPRSEKRAENKVDLADSKLVGLRGSIAVLTRSIDTYRSGIRLIAKSMIILTSIQFANYHADKLKTAESVSIEFEDHSVSGSVVGQTSYGFLIWQSDCECLSVAMYGQVVSVKKSGKRLE